MISVGIQIEVPEIEIGPIWSPPTASAVPSAMPSSRTGKAQMMSRMRAMTASIQPR